MNKVYNHKEVEEKWYSFWEKSGFFTPKIDKKRKPFCILLPLPNANDPIHMGHALFTVEDIMVRYHRMLGEPTLWLPGSDHAGIETQFVFEKKLAERGKSRFDFDRETLYKMISDFVEQNRNININQLKKLGFSLDWTRYHYSLEPEIIRTVLETFHKLYQDGLVYKGERIVNFCTTCGTAFSDLEVEYEEKDDFLYYLDYGLIQIATTRPETIFADVAVAVNLKDKRYKKLIGQKAQIPIIKKSIPIIADEAIDIDFGTGALKVTPAHDTTDFEIGQKRNLETITIIDKNGKMINLPKKYAGLTVLQARQEVIKDLEKGKQLIKKEPLRHTVGICYRCETTIEPMIMPQWFIKIKPLAEPAIKAVEDGQTKITPKKRFEKMYFDWMRNIHDWNISRQIVWGPQIPVWYCLECNQDILLNFIDKNDNKISEEYRKLKGKYGFDEIKKGLQSLVADKNATYMLDEKPCPKCAGAHVLQETDTFDTWFLSGQWPLTTLGYPDSKDFEYFYPTSMLDTLWDILFFWVARMMMFGLYLAKNVPFRIVHLHARVVDKNGQKMSKSKGNVIDPITVVEKYGADALRMALILGVAPGGDIYLSNEKIRGMRNFANKIWNASRYVISYAGNLSKTKSKRHQEDEWIISELEKTVKTITKQIEAYRFGQASEILYDFFWHTFCDKYIEMSKKRRNEAQVTLLYVLEVSLKLLHPFMPFITEEIWQKIKEQGWLQTESPGCPSLMAAGWPKIS
jgi:valyl-tRNA synthetase